MRFQNYSVMYYNQRRNFNRLQKTMSTIAYIVEEGAHMNKAMIVRLFGFFFILNVFLMIDLFFSVSRTILEPLGLVVAALMLFVPIKRLNTLEDQRLSVLKSSITVMLGMLLMGVLFSPIVLIFG